MATPRIIGGSVKGMRLRGIPGDSTRPVTDRVKEAVFNILGADIENANMLDLFGGTGSIGLEALSRGAAFVRFCELNRTAQNVLKENIELTGFKKQAELIAGDAFRLLRATPDKRFEYIYIAPPQYKQMWVKALQSLDKNERWLSDDGWLIVQIHPVEIESVELEHFVCFDERRYGSSALLFFERTAHPEQQPPLFKSRVPA
jgi:16S rRNA (guanine966-N2)-methyltransferase